jgi:hypothetical protein
MIPAGTIVHLDRPASSISELLVNRIHDTILFIIVFDRFIEFRTRNTDLDKPIEPTKMTHWLKQTS